MGDQTGPEGLVFAVLYAVFSTRFFHDFCDCRVMNMADRGEEVMFEVKVQSTHGPAQQAALAVNTEGYLRLMDCPRGFDADPSFGEGEICLSGTMGKLKHQ